MLHLPAHETQGAGTSQRKEVSLMAKGKYEQWLSPEGLLKLESWARDGLTTDQIAKNMGISRSTLNEWVKKYPDISDTLKKGKEIVDITVENALYKRAVGIKTTVKKGFKVKEVKYDKESGKKISETERIEYADEELYIPPDTTAMIFWLKNRLADKWRERQQLVVSGLEEEQSKLDDLISQLRGPEEGD